MPEILVLVDATADGVPKKVTLELLALARRLGDASWRARPSCSSFRSPPS